MKVHKIKKPEIRECGRTTTGVLAGRLRGKETEIDLEEELEVMRAVATARPLFVLAKPWPHASETREAVTVVESELPRHNVL
jgi:hypothetical protein